MTLAQRVRIFPLLVLVAGLALVVRVGDFVAGVRHAGVAFAQHEVDAEAPPLPSADAPHEPMASPEEKMPGDMKGDMEEKKAMPPDSAHAMEGAASDTPPGEGKAWKDAGEMDIEYSEVREDLYKDLVKRRDSLDRREKEMAVREALLKAAERELDQKLREMTAVRNDIQSLLQKQSEEESARIDSLVRIYEGMKAKDAARIFDTLDMDVLISVIGRMSERKSGPILAEMSPERARAVTILLAQQKQIPDIPPQ